LNLFQNLFVEKCPICHQALKTLETKIVGSIVVKTCPENHYQKEFHPALETIIETHKVS
jgi:hypothetical protein